VPVLTQLQSGDVSLDERKRLAQKAFQHVALYDTAIAEYLRGEPTTLPDAMTVALRKHSDLRYGENPHQRGALYVQTNVLQPRPGGVAAGEQLHGKELSYVNILDADAAYQAACDFDEPTVVIVKHMTPCGVASRDNLSEAFDLAFLADPISAFGGIVAINRPVDETVAATIRGTKHPTSGQRLFLEIVVAPDFTPAALELLKKSRDLRILRAPLVPMRTPALEFRGVTGGMLVQDADRSTNDLADLRVVTKRVPTEAEMADLAYAWRCAKHVKSNAITLVKDRSMTGMGAGQPNRVTSARLALEAAGERAHGSVSASEALIPFPDTIEVVAEGGVIAMIQPGGSIRDEEVIAAADARGMAMVFTGVRHFRH
jgi:phosphoribosylaminoimidazolecarboxamide formyltransferase/IMP cyclohydrolase